MTDLLKMTHPMRASLRGLAEAVHDRAMIDMKDVPELPVPDLHRPTEFDPEVIAKTLRARR